MSDWDSLSAWNMAGYHESLAEVDMDIDDAIGESQEGDCYACKTANATVEFMDKPLCFDCYESIRDGKHARDFCSFADPGSDSALRSAGPGNPRIHPCPTCLRSNTLTPQDLARGYQCDSCADKTESGRDW